MRSATAQDHRVQAAASRSPSDRVFNWSSGKDGEWLLLRALLAVLFLVTACCGAFAEQQENALPNKAGLRITFLPPPLEGNLSLGVYDKNGRLVRTLHRDASEREFIIGLNGLITTWDGKNDSGEPMPAGKYFARGFALGDLEIEGVAMHANDWITNDDSPRVRSIATLYPRKDDLVVVAKLDEESTLKAFQCSPDGRLGTEVPFTSATDPQTGGSNPEQGLAPELRSTWMEIKDGEILVADRVSRRALALPGLTKPVAASPSRSGVWVIDDRGDGVVEVKEFTLEGEFKRRLAINPNEPQPREIIALPGRDAILLIEEKPGMQRVRGLSLESPAERSASGDETISTWKVFFTKTIYASDTFASVADKLGREKPFVPEQTIRVRLIANPLLKGAVGEIDLQVGHDDKGSYFRTVDGLPLSAISQTPNLKWVTMGREGGKVVTIFQSDGSVVEEFKARKLAGMMAFDAGEYEWQPGGAK